MNKNRSDGLIVVDIRWEPKPGNAWLLREIYDLLLLDPIESHAGRGPDLTERDVAPTMELEPVLDGEGGEP